MPHFKTPLASRQLKTLLSVMAVVALPLMAGSASASDPWPSSRAVRIIVPAAPGGSSDPLARIVAEELGKKLQQSFVVENKPGANGNIGAAMVAKAEPDGYTLLLSWTGTLVSAVTMYESKPFSPRRDFEPIVLVGSIPNVVVVNKDLPAQNMKELTAYAKTHPGALSFGSTGSGSSWHLAGELYKKTMGVSLLHIPYSSPAAVTTDLIGNRLQVAFPGSTAVSSFVKDGRFKAMAVMADKRNEALPGVPTTKELGYPALQSATWIGLLAPKGTPQDILTKINSIVNNALAEHGFRNRLIQMGYTPMGGTSKDFSSYMEEEIMKWGEVVKFSGAKID